MADEDVSAMNLDLNLGPGDNSNDGNEPRPESELDDAINLEDWLHNPARRAREVIRHRNQRWRSLWRQLPIPPETLNLALELIGGNALHSGEGTVASDEMPTEGPKTCENGAGCVEDEAQGKKKDGGKNNGDEGSFFDCNICLDLAREPIVTCCGHLFCWPCLYRWLQHHSDAKECPVCKGEVSIKNVTPIYGRGNYAREPDVDSGLKIPQRPQARRIESWRQTIQRAAFTIPMEEMIRRLGSTFDLSWEVAQTQSQSSDGPRESPERSNALLSRFLTSRGLRRERANLNPAADAMDSPRRSPATHEGRDSRWLSSLLLRRSSSHRAATLSNVEPAINAGPLSNVEPAINAGPLSNVESAINAGDESHRAPPTLVDTYYDNGHLIINPELFPPVEDRDSLSSIAAVIHSESQTVDNVVEADSTVSLSTSSSRRRYDGSRVSDVDSGDSRRPRRRRLN